eukprot:274484-Pleurochrysis_carterae.AAC.1
MSATRCTLSWPGRPDLQKVWQHQDHNKWPSYIGLKQRVTKKKVTTSTTLILPEGAEVHERKARLGLGQARADLV